MSQNGKCAKNVNVGLAERLISTIVGAKLFTSGLSNASTYGLLKAGIGGLLAHRGISGHCSLYDRVGAKRQAPALSHPLSRQIRVIESVTINCTPEELYSFWRDLRNLPLLVPQIQSVQVTDSRHSRWFIDESSCPVVSWDAFITEDEPNTFIEWVALDNDKVQQRGAVEFVPAVGDRGTIVRIDLKYHPAGGALGAMVANFMHHGPSQDIRNRLHQFKQLMETGEITTNESPSARMTAHDERTQDIDEELPESHTSERAELADVSQNPVVADRPALSGAETTT